MPRYTISEKQYAEWSSEFDIKPSKRHLDLLKIMEHDRKRSSGNIKKLEAKLREVEDSNEDFMRKLVGAQVELKEANEKYTELDRRVSNYCIPLS